MLRNSCLLVNLAACFFYIITEYTLLTFCIVHISAVFSKLILLGLSLV
jgi:hypothetical protein